MSDPVQVTPTPMEQKEKPKRVYRKRSKYTKEQILLALNQRLAEFNACFNELKDEIPKLDSMVQALNLKRVMELFQESVLNLEEDILEVEEEIQRVSAVPDGEPVPLPDCLQDDE